MTPDELTQVARAFDKARNAGPQQLADWATQHAPSLIEALRPHIDGSKADNLAPLRALYPGVTSDLAQQAADDVTALRHFRNEAMTKGRVEMQDMSAETKARLTAQIANTISDDIAAACENNEALETFVLVAIDTLDALRPFAAFGAPIVLEELDRQRSEKGIAAGTPVFACLGDDGATLAAITEDHLKRAHEIINQADGGAGA